MDIYATGFNAWGQLHFTPMAEKEPNDLHRFTKVLSGHSVGRPLTQLSYTAVKRGDEYCLAGLYPAGISIADSPYAEAANGTVLTGTRSGQSTRSSTPYLTKYPSFKAWKSQSSGQSWPCNSPVQQIAAYDAGFVVLLGDNSILTLGDSRFLDCLGREPTEESPAEEPNLVPDISSIDEPIKKAVAGGFAVGVLTEEGSLYVWGTESPRPEKRQQAFADLSGLPNYMEVDGDKDVQDVAFGEAHAIALTKDRGVYVLGSNINGQLGMGQECNFVKTWTQINIEFPSGTLAVGVEAGPRSSFILTSRTHEKAPIS